MERFWLWSCHFLLLRAQIWGALYCAGGLVYLTP